MFKHPFFTSVFPNPIDYLIKPNRNEEFEIFIISSQIPSKDENNVDSLVSRQNIASSVVKPEVANNENSTNPNQEVKFLKSKLNDYLNKINSLQEQLSQEQTNNNFLKNKVDMIEKEKTYLMNQFANVKKDKDIVQENEQPNENPNIDKEESKEQVENLQKVNNKLLEEIESLNEKLEFHKDFYINHLKDLESQLKNNLKINENSIDNSISNYRESLSNMKPSNELNEAKEKFEAEILKLKELMNTEREKYNFVIQNNIEELNKLQNEKNMIKESSARYYEKVILKYDERLKLKNAEIEDLKAKLKKND
jgi:chromosome segregation ATPase